jgi:hypothetical protein
VALLMAAGPSAQAPGSPTGGLARGRTSFIRVRARPAQSSAQTPVR